MYKLSGNRRKPWAVRITDGWDDKKSQKFKYIGFFEKREQALKFLASYNDNPLLVETNKITFEEVYKKWSDIKFPKIAESNVKSYEWSYNYCEELYKMKFADIKVIHLQKVVDECGKSFPTLKKLKTLFNQLFEFSVQNDISDKNYAQFVDIGSPEKSTLHKPFSNKEINKLWEHVDKMEYIDTILIGIYSGVRPGELITIETPNVFLEERHMIGGIKTENGKDRIIPISRKIEGFIEKRLKDNNCGYLVMNRLGQPMKYSNYYDDIWKNIMEKLQMDHYPHDVRHTFASLMDEAGANKLAIKRIMGHASQDITDSVYTHKNLESLIAAVDLI